MFDSYCKKVMSNAGKNYKRIYYRQRKFEIIKDQDYINNFKNSQSEPKEILRIKVEKLECEVKNELLYSALILLPKKHLIIIILSFWYDWKKKAISAYLGLDMKTIYNYKRRAFDIIKNYFIKENKHEFNI